MKISLRDVIVVLLAVVGLVWGVSDMLHGEAKVVIPGDAAQLAAGRDAMLHGLVQYCQGIGMAILLAGIGFVIVDYDEELSTGMVDKPSS
jgi:hypothetical protein